MNKQYGVYRKTNGEGIWTVSGRSTIEAIRKLFGGLVFDPASQNYVDFGTHFGVTAKDITLQEFGA